ncbi:hypothetical protein C8J57DRAFT_1504460 [Mycena rebaudengoi]|nr:hypothetical protein C8J57DRAFT_1504460 [Mycena rebaudengoi]
MPVTFTVASHPTNTVANELGYLKDFTPRDILDIACTPQSKTAKEILQSSFTTERGAKDPKRSLFKKLLPRKKPETVVAPEPETITNVVPTQNGFVNTVILAYNKHHALVIRPDDVWMTILTQFNFFVNANSEALRSSFVAHEGKKELEITAIGTRYSVDFGEMSRQMVDLLEKNVVDPDLRNWVLPSFTTTTPNDTTVSAMLMMATLKAYFEYVFCCIDCGIPRVTLEGEKKDWENILARLEKLKEYGIETIAWYHLLVPVISGFIKSFESPESAENVDFWQRVAHFEPGGSGPSHYSGWINAFCVFDDKGKWLGKRLKMDLQLPDPPESLSAEKFYKTYTADETWTGGAMQLVLNGAAFHCVESENVPPSYAEVDVKLDDNGEKFDCVLTAGLVGTRVTSSDSGTHDTVRPLVGWWMFTKKLY